MRRFAGSVVRVLVFLSTITLYIIYSCSENQRFSPSKNIRNTLYIIKAVARFVCVGLLAVSCACLFFYLLLQLYIIYSCCEIQSFSPSKNIRNSLSSFAK